MTDRERLLRLLRTRSFRLGHFTLASGRTSSYYIDARPTTMSAEGQALIGRLGLQAIHAMKWAPDSVGGLTMGADPVACAIAGASAGQLPPVDAFSVRKEVKPHGAGRRIEGNLKSGSSVVVVEDVITTGSSALSAVDAVLAEGARVLGVLAVVDREEGGRAAVQSRGLTVVVLTTTTDIAAIPR